MISADTVRVWDAWNKEITSEFEPWDTWEKVKASKGFPGGLIAFLQTSTDHEGCGFSTPTSVQAFAWPILQSGKDLVGVAKTGSGKTLAFLLPGFVKLRKLKKAGEINTQNGPGLLTLTPTRELCHQIYSDADKFGRPVSISAACCYGGANRKDQEWAIQQGPDCLIATPGRLNDMVQKGTVSLAECRFAVLDEADRMLDMGFEPQIKEVLDKVPSEGRQTSMFTATWPPECKQLSQQYIKDPIQVQIGSDDITTNKNIRQHIQVVSAETDKLDALKTILGGLPEGGNCLVFCNSKKKVSSLTWDLEKDKSIGLPASEIHGDLDQRARDNALNRFRSGESRILVATDVCSRGLDVRNISIVVNYDAPKSAEDYVHRIGRTGRANDSGDAYTLLLSYGQAAEAKYICEIMKKAEQEAPKELEDLAEEEKKDEGNSWGTSDWKKDDSWNKSESSSKDEWWKKDEKKSDEWSKSDDNKTDGWSKNDSWSDDKDWSKKRPADDWSGGNAEKARREDGKSTSEVREMLVSGNTHALKVFEIKAFLAENGLSQEGMKQDLISRAKQAVDEGSA
jgi:superfamily II DNA/RNA helicase